jgi:hypothetical protein
MSRRPYRSRQCLFLIGECFAVTGLAASAGSLDSREISRDITSGLPQLELKLPQLNFPEPTLRFGSAGGRPSSALRAPPPPDPVRQPPPPPGIEAFQGNQFQWTRLRTSGVYWNRHASGDPALVQYLGRSTALKIDPISHSVRAESVDSLNVYPFIYCDNIAYLTATEAANLAEYLRRGGFLCIDACRNETINRSIPAFLEAQIDVFKTQFPAVRIEQLPPTHEIYSVYFKMAETPPYRKPTHPQYPMYAVYDGSRLIATIGLTGLQCGWSESGSGPYATECAQMMANIYVYAMTR